MSTAFQPSEFERMGRGVLVIGAGGLSSPVLEVLVKSGVTRLTIVDDDRIDLSNLQRQTLYRDEHVARLKVEVAKERLLELAPKPEAMRIETVVDRLVPDNAAELFAGHVLAVEGADNYATKFLASDAAKLLDLPIVQAGAVRFTGWALGVARGRGPCVRCIFEDVPRGQPETCAIAGVLGPVVGVLGALEAAIAIELLRGRERAAGVLWSYDALASGLRSRRVSPRADCASCTGRIRELTLERYLGSCTT